MLHLQEVAKRSAAEQLDVVQKQMAGLQSAIDQAPQPAARWDIVSNGAWLLKMFTGPADLLKRQKFERRKGGCGRSLW